MSKYFILYKPYGVLSQFTKEHPGHKTLESLFDFPRDVYPVGRLDKDSEGLLILTNDKALNHQLLNPEHGHERAYLVQVEGLPDEGALESLRKGVTIKLGKKHYKAKPVKARRLHTTPPLPERHPPIRYRKNVADCWLEIILTEGKNRQVRRMCAKVGFPVLRLVRSSIEGLSIGVLKAGEVQELSRKDIYRLLGLPG